VRRRPSPLSRGAHPGRQGLTSDEVAARFAAQRGRCMVCGSPMPRPQADHDHALAARDGHDPLQGCRQCFRALLCGGCNTMLGGARDDPETLEAGARYLRAWRAQRPL
jgi:hypothetical protein